MSVHVFQFENCQTDLDYILCVHNATEGQSKFVAFSFLQSVITVCWIPELWGEIDTRDTTEMSNMVMVASNYIDNKSNDSNHNNTVEWNVHALK
jgi:hypothetical protein